MGKRKPLAKWVLPTTVNPSTSTCWLVPVPDDPFHKAAFLGALQALGSAYKWQDDVDHTAKDVAGVWRRIADNLTECPAVIQFQNPDPCTLQVSFDNGSTWTTIYSDADCAAANPAQPGGTSRPDLGSCETFHVELFAVSQWYLPFVIGDGDTVEILNATGIWNDSTAQLFCPDGTTYSGGMCSGGPGFNATDPVPTAHHMVPALLWSGGGVGLEPLGTVPGGTGDVDAWLQPNDLILGDNFGSIAFDVRICRTGWTHTFNFLTSDGGFAMTPGEAGTWVSGQGWVAQVFDANDFEVSIKRTFASTTLLDATMMFNRVGQSGSNSLVRIIKAGTSTETQNASNMNGLNQTLHAVFTTPATSLRLDVNNGTDTSGGSITQLVVSGLGTDPF